MGAGLAFVGGQLGPQVGLPEEVVTVPLGAVLGAVIGAKGIERKLEHLF
jgi:hypothetical protein